MLRSKFIVILVICFCTIRLCSQVSIPSASTLQCNANQVVKTLTINSGTPPFNYTLQSPPCTSSITGTTNSNLVSFTLNCPGVYTISVEGASNTPIGVTTHSVLQSSNINISVLEGAGNDTICNGLQLSLYVQDVVFNAGYSYTISSISWSNGDAGVSTLISPTVTTTYSMNGLFTAIDSKTCAAQGYTTIVVQNCDVGFKNQSIQANSLTIFPNPVADKLNIELKSTDVEFQLSVLNILGQTVLDNVNYQKQTQVNINFLPSGVYFLHIRSSHNEKVIKFIKE